MQLIITINTGTPAQQVKKCTIFVDHDLILSLSAWPGVIEDLQRNNAFLLLSKWPRPTTGAPTLGS